MNPFHPLGPNEAYNPGYQTHWPHIKYYITQLFNNADPGYPSGRHKGLDLGTHYKLLPVYSPGDGVVFSSGWHHRDESVYGKHVKIELDSGEIVLLAHLSEVSVFPARFMWEKKELVKWKDGEVVQKGDVIGKVGTTGNSTGIHLHFGVIDEGVKIDPLEWLEGEDEVDYTNFVALTMGDFIGACVDQGGDEFILRREVESFPEDENGEFARREEIIIVPMSMADEYIAKYKPTHISKVLDKFLDLEKEKR